MWLILRYILYLKVPAGRKGNTLYLNAAVRYGSVPTGAGTPSSPSPAFMVWILRKPFLGIVLPQFWILLIMTSERRLCTYSWTLWRAMRLQQCAQKGDQVAEPRRWGGHSTPLKSTARGRGEKEPNKRSNTTQGLSCCKRQLHPFPGE